MAFRLVFEGWSVPLTVVDARPDATVADLAVALARLAAERHAEGARPDVDAPASGAWSCACDGVPAPADLPLRDWVVHRGATVTLVDTPSVEGTGVAARFDPPDGVPSGCDTRAPGQLEVRVVAGPDAGARAAVGPGGLTVGRRGPAAAPGDPRTAAELLLDDPTISCRHLELRAGEPGAAGDAIVHDLGSRNGTWVFGLPASGATPVPPSTQIRVGATVLELREAPCDGPVPAPPPQALGGAPLPGAWATPFHRPPQTPAPAPAAALEAPAPPDPATEVAPPGLAALLIPLVLAGAMVLALHSLLWGLFALTGPLLLLGGFWDQRRRGRGRDRRAARRHLEEAARFEATLAQAVRDEADRRRAAAPDLATVLRTGRLPTGSLWRRRATRGGPLPLRVGLGDLTWDPRQLGHDEPQLEGAPLGRDDRSPVRARLRDVPIEVDLGSGAVVGIVGPRSLARRLARAMVVRACTEWGPSDLALDVASDDPSWDWTRWLPHRPAPASADAVSVLRCVEVDERRRASPGEADGAGARARVGSLVLAAHVDLLPAAVTAIVELTDPHGTATLAGPSVPEPVADIRLEGLSHRRAESAACALAGLRDPDGRTMRRTSIPGDVRLLDLADSIPGSPGQAGSGRAGPATRVTLGVGADGPFAIDLASDGPHVLVAGTTGSGKSELLRTLVAALARDAGPDELTFLLIDFKGGRAFDRLAELPHTVGALTDLSPALTTRTVRSLDAELRRRERVLRSSGSSDLDEHRDAIDRRPQDRLEPLARLVVVVDEFAALAREQPSALDALVSVAQRGRGLGVHLVLATQRPAGVVSEQIKANLGLRIALRLRDATDSQDVVGSDAAARLPRSLPGRAVVGAGDGEAVEVQVASVSHPRRRDDRPAVTVAVGHGSGAGDQALTSASGPTDLDAIVDAARADHAASGAADPIPVCLPPLPARVTSDALAALTRPPDHAPDDQRVVVGVADRPAEQRREPFGWRPPDGGLVVLGAPGSGRSTALLGVATAWARGAPPDRRQLYCCDGAARTLSPLVDWPHVGAVVGIDEAARQARLVAVLAAELHRRRSPAPEAGTGPRPRILVVIDDLDALLDRWGDPLDGVLDRLGALVTQGSAVGLHVALAARRARDLPSGWQASTAQRWLLRSADATEVAGLEDDFVDPSRPPGRVLALPEQVTAQLFAIEAESVRRTAPAGERSALPVHVLPDEVARTGLRARATADGLWVPVGRDVGLVETGWLLRDDDHVLVAGPPRSGRTTALDTVAAAIDRMRPPGVAIVRAAGRRGTGHLEPGPAAELAGRLFDAGRTVVVLVDDADRLDDDGDGLGALAARRLPGVHLVVAMTADAARHRYGHFARQVRSCRLGMLLSPDRDLDGELLGVRLPRRPTMPPRPGRGYVVADGEAREAQVASGRSGRVECDEIP